MTIVHYCGYEEGNQPGSDPIQNHVNFRDYKKINQIYFTLKVSLYLAQDIHNRCFEFKSDEKSFLR